MLVFWKIANFRS